MKELPQNINTGYREQPPLPSDYIAGVESGIVYVENNPSGDWSIYLPTEERQYGKGFDTMACVTFSALNSIEAQLNFLIGNGTLAEELKKWLKDNGYIDSTGRVNFSDRFTAKMSGTSKNGNYLGAVWDSARNHGLLPENDWSFDQENFDWDTYYADIPQALKDKALEFKKRFEIKYEWVLPVAGVTAHDQIWKQLRQAPIQVATAVCPPWNTDEVIKACGLPVQHATLIFSLDKSDNYRDFDQYAPFKKLFAPDYPIPYAMKGVLYIRSQSTVEETSFKHTFSKVLTYGMKGDPEVIALQDALKSIGLFRKDVTSTGNYFEITRLAVLAFQQKYKVASPQELSEVNGKRVGQKTIVALNSIFSGN